jgi:hypothetical protein
MISATTGCLTTSVTENSTNFIFWMSLKIELAWTKPDSTPRGKSI